jgi:DNA polymerase-3 subunit gamma/tau
VDRTRVGELLSALMGGGGAALMGEVDALAGFSPDWAGVLDALADALHRVQVRQLVPDCEVEGEGVDVPALAAGLRPELVQLWYQMALHGRRDLPLAPSPRAGFEMCLLRMLAFRPAEAAAVERESGSRAEPALQRSGAETARKALPLTPAVDALPSETAVAPRNPGLEAPSTKQAAVAPTDPAAPRIELDAGRWVETVAGLALRGPVKELAAHAGFLGHADGVLRLSLPASDDHLKAPFLIQQLAEALAHRLGAAPQIRFETVEAEAPDTLHVRSTRERDARQDAAENAFLSDPNVQRLMSQQGATLVPDSIRPHDDG